MENEVVKKCGTVPVFQAITQFQSDKQNCVNALAAVAEMNTLLEDISLHVRVASFTSELGASFT